MKFRTLQDAMIQCEKESGKGIGFVKPGNVHYVSYHHVYERSLEVLTGLQEQGAQPGDELVFQIADNETFICVFWACIMGGMIPVPVPVAELDEHRQKLFRIWPYLNNPHLATDQEQIEHLQGYAEKTDDVRDTWASMSSRVISVERLSERRPVDCRTHEATADDVVFIQFSSGSTGDPKGVVMTHRNVLHNIEAMGNASRFSEEDIGVSWMPLTHDTGLIGSHLTPVVYNMDCFLMPPSLFLVRPHLWLQTVSDQKATITFSPNFGLQYFSRCFDPQEASSWDLSPLRLLYNGAEPIVPSVVDRFASLLAAYGLDPKVFSNVYGLSEGTLAVTMSPMNKHARVVNLARQGMGVGQPVVNSPQANSEHTVRFVDLGHPIDHVAVRICDDTDAELPELTFGEIQIRGESVTSGYVNNREANARAFTEDGWFRTGDMGFVENGSLIVTGRIKDILFVNGQNLYAHDVERAAEEAGLIPGSSAAVGMTDQEAGEERLVLFVEDRQGTSIETFAARASKVQRRVSRVLGFQFHDVLPVPRIPKTTNGKVQRYLLRDSYQRGRYSDLSREIKRAITSSLPVDEVEATDATESEVSEIWKKVLGVQAARGSDHFFECGGNSLKAAEFILQINVHFDIEVPLNMLFTAPTLHEVVSNVRAATKGTFRPITKTAHADSYPLSSAQESMMRLDRFSPQSMVAHVTKCFEVKGELDLHQLRHALQHLTDRHESLRTYFVTEDGKAMQRVMDRIEFDLESVYSENGDVEDWLRGFFRPFDLSVPPLFRVGVMKTGDQLFALAVDLHHIIGDGFSAGILLGELTALYNGETLPSQGIQYKDYAAWQNARKESEEYQEQEAYWLEELGGKLPVLQLPTDYPRPPVKEYAGDVVGVHAGADRTARLQQLATETGSTLYMVLLAAFHTLMARISGQEEVIVGSPIVGRPHADLENMVGMFANTLAHRGYPSGEKTFLKYLQEVKESTLGAYEHQEVTFETLLDRLQVKQDASRNSVFDVMFSLQQSSFDQLHLRGLEINSLDQRISSLNLDIKFAVFERADGLQCEIAYGTSLFKRERVERWADCWLQILEQITKNPEIRLGEIELPA